jgi:hypothetical protein
MNPEAQRKGSTGPGKYAQQMPSETQLRQTRKKIFQVIGQLPVVFTQAAQTCPVESLQFQRRDGEKDGENGADCSKKNQQ